MGAFNTMLWGGGAPSGTVLVSAESLIYGALRLLGVLRPQQIASVDSMTDGLAWLNEMLDSWATERLLVKSLSRDLYGVTGAENYAIPPHRVEHAGYIDSAGNECPLELYGVQRWAQVQDKASAGSPRILYVDTSFPESYAYPHPVPSSGSLALYQWRVLEAFGDQTTEYALPPGYALALRFNLAVQIAPAFVALIKIAAPMFASIERQAIEHKGRIKSLNVPELTLNCDPAVVYPAAWDIYSGR